MIHPIPDPSILERDKVWFRKSLNSKSSGIDKRIREISFRTDVETAGRPEGDTPVIAAGFALFGDRPSKDIEPSSSRTRGGPSEADVSKSDLTVQRATKIREYAVKLMHWAEDRFKRATTDREKLIAEVNVWQAKTGGGFDNTSVGEIGRSALNFVKSAQEDIKLDPTFERLFVKYSQKLGQELVGLLGHGSVEPDNYLKVRFEQDTDGMIGNSVFSASNKKLDSEKANRIKISSGVDVSRLVGTKVDDKLREETVDARVVDGISLALKSVLIGPYNLNNVIIYLARIQKHGWKLADSPDDIVVKFGDKYVVPKDGKGRSIYPPGAILGAVSAMIGSAFQNALIDKKWNKMPSLMNDEDAATMCFEHQQLARTHGHQVLSIDWSSYDATIRGAFMATIFEYAVKPTVRENFHPFIDATMYTLCHKTMVFPAGMKEVDFDFSDIKDGTVTDVKGYKLVYVSNGLISGDKWTHVIGSLVGLVLQAVIYEMITGKEYPVWAGKQAGDDTLMVLPDEYVDLSSAETTVKPISDIADSIGMKINAGKQTWWVYAGELAAHFLQRVYHVALDVKGIGSIVRSLASMFTSENDKNLSISEQLVATTSRASNGWNDLYVEDGVEFWLEHDQVHLRLYQEYDEGALDILIDTSGGLDSVTDDASFTGKRFLSQYSKTKDGPMFEINRIAARVSSRMEESGVRLEEVWELLGEKESQNLEEESVSQKVA